MKVLEKVRIDGGELEYESLWSYVLNRYVKAPGAPPIRESGMKGLTHPVKAD